MLSVQGSVRKGYTLKPTNVAVDRPQVLKEHYFLVTWTSPGGYSQHINLLPSEWGQRRGGKSHKVGERRQARKAVLEVTSQDSCHFVFIRSITRSSPQTGEITQRHAYQTMELIGGRFRNCLPYRVRKRRHDCINKNGKNGKGPGWEKFCFGCWVWKDKVPLIESTNLL